MIEAPSDGYQRIARTVEETPDTVFVVFLLMRGRCRAYVDELESPATIVVHDLSKDPDLQVYGDWNDDVHKIIRDVNPLEINIYRTTGLPELPFYTRWSVVGALHEAGDLAYNGPARPVEDAADLDGFPSWLWKYHLKRENILSEDAVFGVYEDGECVSVATTAAVGNLYVDIASFTKVPFTSSRTPPKSTRRPFGISSPHPTTSGPGHAAPTSQRGATAPNCIHAKTTSSFCVLFSPRVCVISRDGDIFSTTTMSQAETLSGPETPRYSALFAHSCCIIMPAFTSDSWN